MSYLYASNADPHNRYEHIEFLRDDGSTAELTLGVRYDLSPTELARVAPYASMQYSPLPASGDPIGVYRIPIRGNPEDGQVPIWRADLGVFVPADINVGDRAASVPTDVVGGSNLVANPSFHDGATGYTAGAGTTLTPNSVVGLFGADCLFMARTSSTGAVSIVTTRVPVKPYVPYSASAWVRLATLGTSTARSVTISINWYLANGTLISSSTIVDSEPINGGWWRVEINGAPSPPTAAEAEVQISISGVPTGENHAVDGVTLEVGDVPTNFGLELPASSILGSMLAPATITTREIAASLINSIVAAATAAANPIGLWDFPYTLDPRTAGVANSTFTASNVYYARIQGKGTVTGAMLRVGLTDAAGTFAVGLHRNNGFGRAAVPSTLVAQGAATTNVGDQSVSFGGSFVVNHGDWFSFTTNSATATFLRGQPDASTALTQGLAYFQSGGGGASIPATVGTLFNRLQIPVIVGT